MYEPWTQKKSDIDINGYKCFNFYRKFQNRRANRCNGINVLYIKDCISDGVKLVKNHYDSIIWIKLDKNFFNVESDIYIAGVYIWGENSPAYNSIDVDFFNLLQNDIDDFQLLGKVLLCGDWNARVGNGSRPDYVVCDRYIDDIDDKDYSPDLPLQRQSNDNICNSHGLKLLELCKSTSLRIANGRLGNDCPVGAFTYSSRNGCSVTDYLILNQHDFGYIDNFQVLSFCEWSDHAPLSYNVSCNIVSNKTNDPQYSTKIKWDGSLRDEFRSRLISKLTDLNYIVNQIDLEDRNSINSCVESERSGKTTVQ